MNTLQSAREQPSGWDTTNLYSSGDRTGAVVVPAGRGAIVVGSVGAIVVGGAGVWGRGQIIIIIEDPHRVLNEDIIIVNCSVRSKRGTAFAKLYVIS